MTSEPGWEVPPVLDDITALISWGSGEGALAATGNAGGAALAAVESAGRTMLAAAEPAGGAPTDQVLIATLGASAFTAGLLFLVIGHRWGRVPLLGRVAAFSERVSGLPGWAALPSAVAAVSLLTALVGMYWDISLHIDNGRDAGPLANPGHYLILAGLSGMFAAGLLAIALPLGERPGPAAVRLGEGWYAPVGGLLIAACGAFALVAFPLDDFWHRLFGQDVTLWGPTHLMLIGGAGMSLVGQSILLAEGIRARRGRPGGGAPPSARLGRLRISPAAVTASRRVGLMGGLLIGLSTFQAEFDFGVPQFDQAFQPMFIALAAGIGLVTARLWIGPGGALGAVLFFLVVRGVVSLLVGPVFGQTTPALPLYLGEAACVELAALALVRRPLAFGGVAGVLIGTVGFATEWAWTHAAYRLPWEGALLPEGLVVAVVAGVTGGLVGALLGLGLRGRLPSPAVARATFAAALIVVAGLMVHGLSTHVPQGATAAVTLHKGPGGREATATVRLSPASLGDGARWLTVTAWQGGGLRIARLERVGRGTYRTAQAIPITGDWKATVRLHRAGELLAAPVYMPADAAIPAPAVPAANRFTRTLTSDQRVLQRERKHDVPGWLWGAAVSLVMALYAAFLCGLAWGVGRVARREAARRREHEPPRVTTGRRPRTPAPAGVP